MRRIFKASLISIMAVLLTLTTFSVNPTVTSADSFDVQAESAILIDAETGKILYAKQPDIKLPPASMTKMMTEYLVLEAIDKGQISWDTTTQISDYAYSISANAEFSGIGLTQSKDYTVRQLYEGMAIISDNATTIALAELIAGSEGEFVKMMNAKAKEWGLTESSQFVNTTGLANSDLGDQYPEGTDPKGQDLLSAKAAAIIGYHIVNDYPEALEISSTMRSELDGRELQNLNWMLPWEDTNFKQFYMEGVDGLKTGWTDEAGYCFTGTAERDGRRLISVVMKTSSKEARFVETKKLLEYGFNTFTNKELYPEGYQVKDESVIPVAKGKEDQVEIATASYVKTAIKNGEEKAYEVTYHLDKDKLSEDGELIAPVKKGDKVGTMEVTYTGENDYGYVLDKGKSQTVDLVATSTVEKANWFMLTMGSIGDFFSNLFSGIADTVKGWF
ncbi:D-alanyl-D-alanine carboxypeptidase [Radiobacillus kanasensis]|uniref:D-alanyl-D-alanine carboxypeptidase family protein n=1 Tax=Radiobacillus kanasensis TaxID=2844358 RepID=UPI001E6310D2|nr:serine hydrolase [Radiobacillus kanasensis]UFT99438.1 D-alanyl-D-alanine carboxypeptidase [Radiobacillus kanasensis]